MRDVPLIKVFCIYELFNGMCNDIPFLAQPVEIMWHEPNFGFLDRYSDPWQRMIPKLCLSNAPQDVSVSGEGGNMWIVLWMLIERMDWAQKLVPNGQTFSRRMVRRCTRECACRVEGENLRRRSISGRRLRGSFSWRGPDSCTQALRPRPRCIRKKKKADKERADRELYEKEFPDAGNKRRAEWMLRQSATQMKRKRWSGYCSTPREAQTRSWLGRRWGSVEWQSRSVHGRAVKMQIRCVWR
jgi:hypothetical protein